jgi:hypothetical protein
MSATSQSRSAIPAAIAGESRCALCWRAKCIRRRRAQPICVATTGEDRRGPKIVPFRYYLARRRTRNFGGLATRFATQLGGTEPIRGGIEPLSEARIPREIKTLGDRPERGGMGGFGFQDRCLQPLGHPSVPGAQEVSRLRRNIARRALFGTELSGVPGVDVDVPQELQRGSQIVNRWPHRRGRPRCADRQTYGGGVAALPDERAPAASRQSG